jgi:hypothetical protein
VGVVWEQVDPGKKLAQLQGMLPQLQQQYGRFVEAAQQLAGAVKGAEASGGDLQQRLRSWREKRLMVGGPGVLPI